MAGTQTTTEYRFAPIPEDVLYDGRLGANEIRIYGALMRHGMDASNCYPSRERLASRCHMSVSTVKRAIATLVETDWIERIERFDDDGAQTSNGYHVRTSPPVHGRTAPSVTSDPPPGSPVTHKGKPVKERNTLTLLSGENEQPDTTPAAQIETDFDEWWSGVWAKKSIGAARKAYKGARKKGSREELLLGRDAYARLMKAQGTEPRYWKMPATWLNQECWLDEEGEAPNPFEAPPMRFG